MTNQIKYIRKSQQMEITKNQIQLTINKTELNTLISDALANPDISAAIKRALNPLLANSFPQFPEFSQITLGDTDEAGATQVILKQPAAPKTTGPIKSIEPQVIDDEPEEEVVEEEEEELPASTSTAYVDPLA